jgi:chemotaxis protein methyltransferase CheR
MIQDVTEEEMNSLTQSILTRYGIDFTCYEPKSLRRRITRVLNRFNHESVHSLWVHFLQNKDFVHVFMNEISVGMTSMFRDPVLWRNLKTRLQTEYVLKDKISIWHAGCSTGEEVYTLGILLRESNLMRKATALATDFNKDALAEAQKGEYHKIKMIENETNYRQFNPTGDMTRYYTTVDGKHVVMDPALVGHATFKYHNLVNDPVPGQKFDIIFCRNVMIYFDTIAKHKLLDKFHASLNPGGFLIIGFFDTMNHLIDEHKFNLADEAAKIFKKVA